MDILLPALEQTILFFPLALGVYFSFSILRITDMTIEGSFVLGAAIFARLMSLEVNLILSLMASVLAGALAGALVSGIQANAKVNPLTAGIIGLFILYSANFQIMGRPNIGLHDSHGLSFSTIFGLIACMTLLIYFLIKSKVGLLFRAFGNNQNLLKSLGKNINYYRLLGLSLCNALAAICGSLTADVNGYADLGMGFGMTLTGISTVMIGQQVRRKLFVSQTFNIFAELCACFMGVLFYFLAIHLLLSQGFNPIHLKLLLGLFMIFLLREKLYG